MSTNFFEQQDKARKRTGLLVACFIIGLLLMIAVLYAVTMIIFNMVGMDNEGPESYAPEFWSPGVLGLVACVTTLLVGGSSLFFC